MLEQTTRSAIAVAHNAETASNISGVASLAHFGLIQFSGDDAQPFLQGQLSCDVSALTRDQALIGSYSTPKGRMLASFLLWRDNAGYMMQLPRILCDPIRKRLTMYILRSRVQARDVSDEYAIFGAVGANAIAVVASKFTTIPSTALAMTGTPTERLLRLDAQRLQIIVTPDAARELQQAIDSTSLTLSQAAWDYTNILSGIPFITPATQEQFVPQMANLDLLNGVSFAKGCYPGQEIVARMHYLGKLKQRMYRAHISTAEAPQPGDKVYSPVTGDQATGAIVNAAPAPGGGYAVLAVMHIESYNARDVRLKSLAGPQLNFLPLPYTIPV